MANKEMIRQFMKRTLDQAVNLVFPLVCPLCGKILPLPGQAVSSAGDAGISGCNSVTLGVNPYICPDCYGTLVFPEEPRCFKCSRPLEEETQEYCTDCGREIRHFDRGIALLMHDEAAKKILYDLKYHNRRDNAKMLAREAADRLHGVLMRWDPDVVIPVPLHKKRELKRGFNQAALLTEFLVRNLKEYGLSLMTDPDYLVRVKTTSAQKELLREQRNENIRNAFEISYKEDPRKYEGRTILLIDDIYTSGVILSECAKVLKAAGAGKVLFLTFSIG